MANLELVRTIREESENKGLDIGAMFDVAEKAIKDLARQKYGMEKIDINIDRNNGAISLKRKILVVDDEEYDELLQSEDGKYEDLNLISYSNIVKSYPNAGKGEIIVEDMPPLSSDSISLRGALHSISRMINQLEKDKQYEIYSDREGELISGVVKKTERNGLVVDISGIEAFLPGRSIIKGEFYKNGDRIRAYIESVQRKDVGHQIILSRSHDQFVACLFKTEIPEVYDGLIEVKKVVREAGSRAKVAVFSPDRNIDAVGACIGIKGARIRSIINEIGGEKIDVIEYSSDPALFVVNAISPTEVVKVVIDEDEGVIELIVPNDQLSLAIGRRGQNVRLASALLGWRIDIVGEDEASERRLRDFKNGTTLFMEALNVEEMIAQLLVAEGFVSIEDLIKTDQAEVAAIDGFDLEIAKEIIERAQRYVEQKNDDLKVKIVEKGIDRELLNVPNLNAENIIQLHEKLEVKTMEDFAYLSKGELLDCKVGLDSKQAAESIMDSRKKMGWL